jgi:hypothetical protein
MFSFKCWLFGHAETEKDKIGECVEEKCTRCRRVLSRDYTYEGRAKRFLASTHRSDIYHPVESIADGDGRKLKPGDSIKYKELNPTFPGLHLGTNGTVEFLFEDTVGERSVKVRRKRNLINERRIMGIRNRK